MGAPATTLLGRSRGKRRGSAKPNGAIFHGRPTQGLRERLETVISPPVGDGRCVTYRFPNGSPLGLICTGLSVIYRAFQ